MLMIEPETHDWNGKDRLSWAIVAVRVFFFFHFMSHYDYVRTYSTYLHRHTYTDANRMGVELVEEEFTYSSPSMMKNKK